MLNFKNWLENDYHISHRPPESDFGAPLHDLTKIYPKDVYEKPHYYATGDLELESAYKALSYKDKPSRLIWIFRAVPEGIKTINPGDWVTINRKYAIQHGKHPFDKKQDMIVIAAKVPASSIHTDGNSFAEWGYNGPEPIKTIISYKPR